MAKDLMSLVLAMREAGDLDYLLANPLSQFGPPDQPFLGARLLPERMVPENAYREEQIHYRTVIANDGSRYSPAQRLSTGQIVGGFLVELGNQDVAQELVSRELEAINLLLGRNADKEANASAIQWFDRTIVQALVTLEERQRWEAIVNASVVRLGDNAYSETVTYPNPTGHRAAVGGDWTATDYDPFDDIDGMVTMMQDKGYSISSIITRRAVVSMLVRNQQVIRRVANVRTLSDGDLFGRVTLADINAYLMGDGLPPITTYDNHYNTLTGRFPFLPAGTMVFAAATGRTEEIQTDDEEPVYLPDTLGYTAIGVAVGRTAPGRAYHLEAFENKPPRLTAEGWQTSLPVITDPEALAVLTGIGDPVVPEEPEP